MKRWRCACGRGGQLPASSDALVEGYRRLMEHQKEHATEESER